MPEALPIRYVQANGLRFAYLEEGVGPLVLLVHGFPDTPHTWNLVRPAIAKLGFRVVTPFTRGYAPTEIPKEHRTDADTLGRDLIALIESLGESNAKTPEKNSAIVIGHDFGAGAAYSAAALAPSHVRFLVTIGVPHPASVTPTPGFMWTVRHFLTLQMPGAVEHARENDFAHIDELVQRWSPGWDVPKGETDEVKKAFREPGSLNAALGYYRAIRPWLPPGQKKKISVPTVSIAGENDVISPAVYEHARSRFTGAYDVVTMPGSHFMHRQHPDRFIAELTKILEKVQSDASSSIEDGAPSSGEPAHDAVTKS